MKHTRSLATLATLATLSGSALAQANVALSLAQPMVSGHHATVGFTTAVRTSGQADGQGSLPTPSPNCKPGTRQVFLAAWDIGPKGPVLSNTVSFDNTGGAKSHACLTDGASAKGTLVAREVGAEQTVAVTATLGDWLPPVGAEAPPLPTTSAPLRVLPVAVVALLPCTSPLRAGSANTMRIQLSGMSQQNKTVQLQSSASGVMNVPHASAVVPAGRLSLDIPAVVPLTAQGSVTFTASDAFNRVQCTFSISR